MPKYLLIATSSFMLAACAYLADGATQSLEVRTPGANNARCDVYVGGTKFIYMPPETRMVQKSEDDLVVDCHAPGNRRKKVVIAPVISASTAYNVGNGVVPGLAWDYASKSLYSFPPVVEVDFTNMRPQPSPLPAQNQPDIKQPEEYDLEEFRPGQPRMNSDRYAPDIQIKEREVPTEFDLDGFGGQSDQSRAVIGRQNSGMQVPTPPSASSNLSSSSNTSSESASSGLAPGEGEAPAMSVPNLLEEN